MRTKDPNNKGWLRVLRAYRNNPSGSLREITKAAKLSQTTVYYHLNVLEDEGILTRNHYCRRPAGGIDKKKSKAGKIGRGGNAFEPKKTKKKDTGLDERIELVVRMAREREKQGESGNAHDVVAHLPFKFNRKATKVA